MMKSITEYLVGNTNILLNDHIGFDIVKIKYGVCTDKYVTITCYFIYKEIKHLLYYYILKNEPAQIHIFKRLNNNDEEWMDCKYNKWDLVYIKIINNYKEYWKKYKDKLPTKGEAILEIRKMFKEKEHGEN